MSSIDIKFTHDSVCLLKVYSYHHRTAQLSLQWILEYFCNPKEKLWSYKAGLSRFILLLTPCQLCSSVCSRVTQVETGAHTLGLMLFNSYVVWMYHIKLLSDGCVGSFWTPVHLSNTAAKITIHTHHLAFIRLFSYHPFFLNENYDLGSKGLAGIFPTLSAPQCSAIDHRGHPSGTVGHAPALCGTTWCQNPCGHSSRCLRARGQSLGPLFCCLQAVVWETLPGLLVEVA
jgi:hypothetical protein